MAHLAKLDRQAKLLLTMNTLFLISVALSNTFVNVYLWKMKQDFTMIAIFNLFHFSTIPFAFWIAGKMVKKVDRIYCIRIGVTLMSLFYIAVLLSGKGASAYIPLFGILLGLGSGFYWLGYNVLYFEITGPENRDIYNGTNGFLASGAGMLAPLVAGWLLSRMTQLTGYRVIFSLSLGIFLFALITSLFIKKRAAQGELSLKEVWRETRKTTKWRYVVLAHLFLGVREGVFAFLIGLLVYIVSASEFTLGLYTFVTSTIALLAYYIAGRWMKPKRRQKSLVFAAVMLFLVSVPLLIQLNFITLILLGIGSSFFFPFFSIPLTSTTFDVIGEDLKRVKLRVEYIIMREFALSLGRVISIGSFILLISFQDEELFIALFLVIVNVVLLFSWSMMKRVLVKYA